MCWVLKLLGKLNVVFLGTDTVGGNYVCVGVLGIETVGGNSTYVLVCWVLKMLGKLCFVFLGTDSEGGNSSYILVCF